MFLPAVKMLSGCDNSCTHELTASEMPAQNPASWHSSMEEEGVPKPVSTGLVKVINLNLH